MKLLNKHNLAVRFAASKEESRYTMRAILATENETVATDGHMLARVSLARAADPSKFPTVDGFKPNGFTRGLIPVEAAKEIENAIPKKTTLPILNFAAISTEHVGENDVLKVAATDLSTPKVFTVRQPDGSFPTWDGSIWPDQTPVIDICFDAQLLASIATAAAKFSDKALSPIRLRFYSSTSAMRFDVVNDEQEMNGLLMPCRADVRSTFKEKKISAPAPEPDPVPEATEVDCHSDADSGL